MAAVQPEPWLRPLITTNTNSSSSNNNNNNNKVLKLIQQIDFYV
jgi:hypothetical protein